MVDVPLYQYLNKRTCSEHFMLHPDIELRKSKISGTGLFAKKCIPKGTIIYIGKKDKVYTLLQYQKLNKKDRQRVIKFAFEDEKGNLVFVRGNAKYWNHSCDPNCGPFRDVDIAIKNICMGDELTYDYAFLHPKWCKPLTCRCGSKKCRYIIKREPVNSKTIKSLIKSAKLAGKYINKVHQPLQGRN